MIESFNQYQSFTKSLARYNEEVITSAVDRTDPDNPAISDYWMPYMYPVLALGEEAGEVQGKIAKFIRKSNQGVTHDQVLALRDDIRKELGDVLYSVSEVARQFGWTLQEIVDGNEEKLTDRAERGVLVGEGDER